MRGNLPRVQTLGPTLVRGLSPFCAAFLLCCGTSTIHVAPETHRDSYSEDASGPSNPTSKASDPERQVEAPAWPKCAAEESAKAKFPERTDGASYRAIIRLTIAPDGNPQDECFLLAEGDEELAGKALEGRKDWKYNPTHAGQKRDVVVTYRYR
jgi:outer membrane biosynthesis protein TonB